VSTSGKVNREGERRQNMVNMVDVPCICV
jgi:hypothetical protein